MTSAAPAHDFDERRATEFEPRSEYVKIAVLVEVADPDALTVLRTAFGEQAMRGPFYVVADGETSYGAARSEFESSHERVGANAYRKSTPVLAYQVDDPCRVRTDVDGNRESSVMARPGDWIVRQHSGEVMVVDSESFDERYRPRR